MLEVAAELVASSDGGASGDGGICCVHDRDRS